MSYRLSFRILRQFYKGFLILGILPVAFVLPAEAGVCKIFGRFFSSSSENTFHRSTFLKKLKEQRFSDSKGATFSFDADMTTIYHSKLGRSRNVWPGKGESGDKALMENGDLDWTDNAIEYPDEFKNRGFTGRLFEFFKNNLPDGSHLSLVDASDSYLWNEFIHQRVSNDKMQSLLASDSLLQTLWKQYKKLLAIPGFQPDYSRVSTTEKQKWLEIPLDVREIQGFKMYVNDLTSVWGRIARKGNYRKDYRGPLQLDYYVRIKREIPADFLKDEEALIQSSPGGDFTGYLQGLMGFSQPKKK